MEIFGFIVLVVIAIYVTCASGLAVLFGGLDLGVMPAKKSIPVVLAVIVIWIIVFMVSPFEITVK